MTNDVLAAGAPTAVETARRLLLIWQEPESRRLIRVGKLDQLIDGKFAFRYLPEARDPGFSPLVQFPDIDRLYVSSRLPSLFANRVMSARADDTGSSDTGSGWRRMAPTRPSKC